MLAGIYPANIAQDVTPERLRRFFLKEDAGWRVKKEIREMLVFAIQNVIKDPPFTKLDLLSCRNLMIYLEPELQNRLIPAFHYALKPGGILFLSPSESIGNHTSLFEAQNRKWKFYRATPTVSSTRAVMTSGLTWAAGSGGKVPGDIIKKVQEPNFAERTKRMLLQTYAPASVLTDTKGDILYVHGDTGKYLRPAPGHPSLNAVEMAREGLPLELRKASVSWCSKMMRWLPPAWSICCKAWGPRCGCSTMPRKPCATRTSPMRIALLSITRWAAN
jgi:two-component system CheB/CheR fusion protein